MIEVFRRRVAFSETDASGRVHFTAILKWAEDAEHQLLHSLGIAVFSEEEGWPRVRVECDYRLPLKFEEEVALELQLNEIGGKSLRWAFRVLSSKGAVAAEGTLVTVKVSEGEASEISVSERIELDRLLQK